MSEFTVEMILLGWCAVAAIFAVVYQTRMVFAAGENLAKLRKKYGLE